MTVVLNVQAIIADTSEVGPHGYSHAHWRRIEMILWTIKLLNTVKKVIAGRKYPHQLAWATAFGLLLGIVPHGNLLAVALLVLVLSLRINHAMVALTAIATTFLVASRFDPVAHLIGDGEEIPLNSRRSNHLSVP